MKTITYRCDFCFTSSNNEKDIKTVNGKDSCYDCEKRLKQCTKCEKPSTKCFSCSSCKKTICEDCRFGDCYKCDNPTCDDCVYLRLDSGHYGDLECICNSCIIEAETENHLFTKEKTKTILQETHRPVYVVWNHESRGKDCDVCAVYNNEEDAKKHVEFREEYGCGINDDDYCCHEVVKMSRNGKVFLSDFVRELLKD